MEDFNEEIIKSLKKMSPEQLEALGRKVYKERNSIKIQKLVYYELCKVKDEFLKNHGFDSVKEKEVIRQRIYDSLGV